MCAWWDPPAEKRMPTNTGIKGAQIETEIAEFVRLLLAHGVKSYLEIGGKYGDTFWRVMMSLPEDTRGVVVDLPTNTNRQGILELNCSNLKKLRPNTHLILGNSHDQAVIEAVQSSGPFDACLIDGDRTWKGITADWQNFGSLSTLTAFHDIRAAEERLNRNDGTEKPPDMMAPKLWGMIKAESWETLEIADQEEHCGIGVVFNHREARL